MQQSFDFPNPGALSDRIMLEMHRAGLLRNLPQEGEKIAINPASFDTTVKSLYRVDGFLPPKPNQSVLQRMKDFGATPHNPSTPLSKKGTYLAELEQTIRLPESVWGLANPKSSTGRGGAHVSLVTDSSPRYERIQSGYDGPLWLVIRPLAFNLIIKPGEALAQVRLFTGNTKLGSDKMLEEARKHHFIWPEDSKNPFSDEVLKSYIDSKGALMLHSGLFGEEKNLVGYASNGTPKPLDLSARKAYRWQDFFDPVLANKNGRALIREGFFYLLSSQERVRVPPNFACGMVAVDEELGEFRTHYAGFIDPGFGEAESADGFIGRTLTLEVTAPYDTFIEEGQPVACLTYEKMCEVPQEHYDAKATSNYKLQKGPTFSKHFITEETD